MACWRGKVLITVLHFGQLKPLPLNRIGTLSRELQFGHKTWILSAGDMSDGSVGQGSEILSGHENSTQKPVVPEGCFIFPRSLW